MCQFKGPATIDDPDGRAKDIRSYQWGYQWAFDMADAGDLDYAYNLVKDAYDREQRRACASSTQLRRSRLTSRWPS